MLKVFIDTSAFIALFNTSEKWHKKIFSKYEEYKKQNAFFYTSYFVLNELYTRLIYLTHKKHCQKAIKSIEELKKEGNLKIFRIDPVLFRKSEKVFLKFAEHKISFIDAAICVCVKEFKLDEVFTLDKDFRKIGLKVSPI